MPDRVPTPSPAPSPRPAGRPGEPTDAPATDGAEARDERAAASRALAERAAPDALLAHAFRSQAEAVEGIRKLQGDLLQVLKRQDRSDLVLRSTNALNETFRQLTSTQQQLLRRLEAGEERAPSRLVPVLLLGLLVVLLGGVWVVLELTDPPSGATVAASDGGVAAYQGGVEEGRRLAGQEIERLEARLEELTLREDELARLAAETEREAVGDREALYAIQYERDQLAAQVLSAQNEILARRAVEQELERAQTRLEILGPRVDDLQEDLDAKREENLELRARLGRQRLGVVETDPLPEWVEGTENAAPPLGADAAPRTPVPAAVAEGPPADPRASPPDSGSRSPSESDGLRGLDPWTPRPGHTPTPGEPSSPAPTAGVPSAPSSGRSPPPPPPPPPGPAESFVPGREPRVLPSGTVPHVPTAAPPAEPVAIDRDPAFLAQLRGRVNDLLRVTGRGRAETWQLASVGGVSEIGLHDVIAHRYDGVGRLQGRVQADRLRFTVDAARRLVTGTFEAGSFSMPGGERPFDGGIFRRVLAEGDASALWSRSGLLFVRTVPSR